jgi:trehalose 6-phosphate phosphatase
LAFLGGPHLTGRKADLEMTPPIGKNSALFLDIDGTLLDMARTPDAVVVPADLVAALSRLQRVLDGALAFVSGRSLEAIDRLFAPLGASAIGCHGAEVRGADGKLELLAAPISEPVRLFFEGLVARHDGTVLEDKKYALALHYRLAPEARPLLEEAVAQAADFLSAQKVVAQNGKAVIDIKPQGVDKGVGVRALLRAAPFRGRIPLFGGDDTTDMDVFHILPELGGRGFSVGRSFEGVEYHFSSPLAVRQWLCDLAIQASLA